MSGSCSSSKKMILLKSSDDKIFEIEEPAAFLSQTIKNLIEDVGCTNNAIPLGNVQGKTLAKVIEYCNMHAAADAKKDDIKNYSSLHAADADKETDDLKEFDKKFVDIDMSELFELLTAANYLDIKKLLDVTAQAIADKIKNKTPEEIRKIFNVENDFTPEEEKAIRVENAWAFE